MTTISPSACGIAARTAAPLPRLGCRTSTTPWRPSCQRSTRPPVPSVEPSSTTTICFSRSSAQTASRSAPIVAASLYAGTRKDTRMAAQPNLQGVRFDLEVRIEQPVAAVFAYVTDVRNLPHWQESAVGAEWIEEGSRFRERRSFLGRTADIELEVTALEQGRRFDVRAVTGPVRFEIRHSFEADGAATLLEVTADAPIGGALRFAARMARRQAERQFRSDLQRLKEVLEGRDEESPSDRPPRLAAE